MEPPRAKPLDNLVPLERRREFAVHALDIDLDDSFWDGLVRRAENGDRAAANLLRYAGEDA